MSLVTLLSEGTQEDFALMIGDHLSTRDIFALPSTCSFLRSLAQTRAWRKLLGQRLCPIPAELGPTLQRAAVGRARRSRHDLAEKSLKRNRATFGLDVRTSAAARASRGHCHTHPLTPCAEDARANRRLGFRALSRSLEPALDELLPYRPYLAAVTSHPAPSRKQLVDFAEYLCGAHSWYKHLPNPPGHAFHVFFHPAAMMFNQDAAQATGATEILAGERHFHYSTMSTREYRTRFSICDYYCAEARMPETIRDVDGTELLLPPRVSSGAESLIYLSAVCFQAAPNGREPPPEAQALRASAAELEAAAFLTDAAGVAAAVERTRALAQDVEGVEAALAAHNGAPMGGPMKRRELYRGIYNKQTRAERQAIVTALVRQAEAIWGVGVVEDSTEKIQQQQQAAAISVASALSPYAAEFVPRRSARLAAAAATASPAVAAALPAAAAASTAAAAAAASTEKM